MQEDKLTLAVEEANTKLLEIINESIMVGYSKAYAKTLVVKLIDETEKQLNELGASEQLILDTKLSLQKAFMKQWLLVINILLEKAKTDELGLIGKQIAAMKTNTPLELKGGRGITIDIVDKEGKPVVGLANAQINNLRDFITGIADYEKDENGNYVVVNSEYVVKHDISQLGGTSRFVNYKTMLQDTLMEIKDKLADGTLTLTDSLGRTKSIRNMAEIETRYQMINQDLDRQGVKLNDFVIASSHEDASQRCSFWQGKIYLMDLDIASRPMGQYKGGTPTQTILGYIDGKPYYSLLQACNNGFLSFNCQHRLIKYYKGANPVKYDMISVKKARNLTITQRQMENTIRHWKRRERVADKNIMINRKDCPYIENGYWFSNGQSTGIKASDHSQELKSIASVQRDSMSSRDYSVSMTNYWQDKYSQFSTSNDLPTYEWRTRITDYER